jgi:hypothetical protein
MILDCNAAGGQVGGSFWGWVGVQSPPGSSEWGGSVPSACGLAWDLGPKLFRRSQATFPSFFANVLAMRLQFASKLR